MVIIKRKGIPPNNNKSISQYPVFFSLVSLISDNKLFSSVFFFHVRLDEQKNKSTINL